MTLKRFFVGEPLLSSQIHEQRLSKRVALAEVSAVQLSLPTDYFLKVSASIASGVAAITSSFPHLFPYRIHLCELRSFALE